jgi:pimeloyl-ACP methyl ester carboxylesterase
MPSIEPFRIAVPDADLDDLRLRLREARWPDQLPDSGWDYGADYEYLRPLARYWADEYDWRAHETALNRFPGYLTEIQGQRIHFLHVRSPHEDAMPLVLTHGWPGSISEFARCIDPLVDPTAHGGQASDAFHVVVPALPGYGWSGPTHEPGWNVRRTASAWAELMARLGYTRYGAQGGDWGSFVTRHLADLDAEHLCGVHVNMMSATPPGAPDDLADLSPREQAQLARTQDYLKNGSGYVAIQSTRPQTLAYGLNDSPVGLLSWIVEKFWAWADHDGHPEDAVARDELLTNVSIYWFTQTAGSSARMYYESITSGAVSPPDVTKVPLGVGWYPDEILMARRRWVEASNNLVWWNEAPRGGHFAAMEEPDLFVDDVRGFFRLAR